jgi:hypothetical protein
VQVALLTLPQLDGVARTRLRIQPREESAQAHQPGNTNQVVVEVSRTWCRRRRSGCELRQRTRSLCVLRRRSSGSATAVELNQSLLHAPDRGDEVRVLVPEPTQVADRRLQLRCGGSRDPLRLVQEGAVVHPAAPVIAPPHHAELLTQPWALHGTVRLCAVRLGTVRLCTVTSHVNMKRFNLAVRLCVELGLLKRAHCFSC